MLKSWLTEDHRIHLPKLFEYLGYQPVGKENTHRIYIGNGMHYVVLYTEDGFLYYKTQRPEEKLSASDLIIEHSSRGDSLPKEMLWDKLEYHYKEVLGTKNLLLDKTAIDLGDKVAKNFNHFLSYSIPLDTNEDDLYAELDSSGPFEGRVFKHTDGGILFPLYNIQNEVCGHFIDGDKGVLPLGESAIKHSLWYSNIPKTIDGLFLFKDPKEAIAFHRKFQLKKIVYLALGDINSQTTQILFQIQRLVKVEKLFLSFTGSKKIEGYLRDLHFISFVEDSNFKLSLTDRDMVLRFPVGSEKSFSRFYDHTRQFNQELTNSFLKYNKIIDQNKLNRYSILISKDGEEIKVRLPLETNAIKLVVWSYYKNYLDKAFEILKPTSENWCSEWELTKTEDKKGKEVHLKQYRIAL